MVQTPVLFETFARPDYARQAFDAIKKVKPKVLYFYSNKARADRPDEVKRNEEVRSLIKEIDWECDLHTFFREEYVDVFTSLWGSLDWFFNNVDEGIVLEEDCVASPAFFDYCEKLLVRYRDETSVRLISGDNFTPEFNPGEYDYFFSHMTHIYGWASWKNRWKNLDRTMAQWNSVKRYPLQQYYPHYLERAYYLFFLNRVYNIESNALRSWDNVTIYNMIKNGEVSIIPRYNLVVDIGALGANSTVSNNHVIKSVEYEENTYPTSLYPSDLTPIDDYDYPHFKKHKLMGLIRYEMKKFVSKICKRK